MKVPDEIFNKPFKDPRLTWRVSALFAAVNFHNRKPGGALRSSEQQAFSSATDGAPSGTCPAGGHRDPPAGMRAAAGRGGLLCRAGTSPRARQEKKREPAFAGSREHRLRPSGPGHQIKARRIKTRSSLPRNQWVTDSRHRSCRHCHASAKH